MEDPCKIVTFGDSITRGYTDRFQETIVREYAESKVEVMNQGISGETTRDGMKRLGAVLDLKPDVVVIGLGMNDWRKGVGEQEFRKNLCHMIDAFERQKTRVVLMNIIPNAGWFLGAVSSQIKKYNEIILSVALQKRVRMVDVHSLWRRSIFPHWIGLRDSIHPNPLGYKVINKALMRVVPRRTTTVLWGYNGFPCACNYRCPYCIDQRWELKGHHFRGKMDDWYYALKRTFGNQHLSFYISYGEPMVGRVFYEMMDMLATDPNWEMMMTSNLSRPLDRLVETRLAKEGRLNINASFHPTETTIEEFLPKILFLRDHGIECPVIYVMYPPQMQDFEEYFRVFDQHDFLVHVRRFSGKYQGKTYPRDYTEAERRFVAKYADRGTIKYILNEPDLTGKLSYKGMYFVTLTHEGDVTTEYYGGRELGSIFRDDVRLDIEPQPLEVSTEGAVTEVSCILETGYHELSGNYVLSFARQGGVYHTESGVHYSHLNTDFSDPEIRKQLCFPNSLTRARNVVNAPKRLVNRAVRFRRRTARKRRYGVSSDSKLGYSHGD
jgi:acyl-CoA thioesterase-1